MLTRRHGVLVRAAVVGGFTLAEAKELEALYDFRIQRTKATFDAHKADVIRGDLAWPVDFSLLLQRYKVAKDSMPKGSPPGVATPGASDDTGVRATDTYMQLARAVQQVDMTRTKGDLSDLMNRLALLGFPVDETGQPQPNQDASPQDTFYRATNNVPTPAGLFAGLKLLAVGWLLYTLTNRSRA